MESVKSALALLLCAMIAAPPFGYAQSPSPANGATPDRSQHRPDYQAGQLKGDDRILQALNRLTFGPRPGDLDAVRTMGLDAWFEQQLHPQALDETALNERLALYPAMQWSVADLLYRVPSNAIIRQAIAGKVDIPRKGTLHAVYENQMYRVAEKRAEKEQQKNAQAGQAQMGTQVSNAQGQTPNGQAPAANGQLPAMASPESQAPAIDGGSGGNQMATDAPAMNPSAPESAASNPAMATVIDTMSQPEFPPFASISALAPRDRVAQLQQMQTAEFDAFMHSLKGPQRNQLAADMTPDLREALEDLENPQRMEAEELMAERLTRDIYSSAQLQEVMTDFWLNHFNIYLRKNEETPYYLASYARDTIRPNALGKFEDLLEAVAHSPSMMLYLDNSESMGPDSPAAERAKMQQMRNPGKNKMADEGLNENYARELMELHTLGVNGGYTQADVTQVARILTGWTVNQPQRGGSFEFNENRHEPGAKKVMGTKFKDDGEREGEALLHFLVTRPATAQFISRKLAVRFVSDDPPQTLVDRMAKTYMSTGGDISSMLRTLFHSPEFWATSDYRAKVKTPLEFVVSAVRASNADVENFQPLENALRQMGMQLFGCIPPTGYKWVASEWVSTGALVDRMNFALSLAANRLPGVRVSWSNQPEDTNVGLTGDSAPNVQMAPTPTLDEEETRLEPMIVPGGVGAQTRAAALAQFESQSEQDSFTVYPVSAQARPRNAPRPANALERQDEVLAGLLIGSPEFQRR
ncbi:MAG: DUF1800 domain-containing protein [Terracidiphilus sp.]